MVDKIKELRDSIADVIAMADVEYERRRDADRNLDTLITVVRAECTPVIYGIFRKGYGGILLSKVEDRADSGHCDLHYGGLIEEGKRYGLILLPEKGKYICAPIKKEKP